MLNVNVKGSTGFSLYEMLVVNDLKAATRTQQADFGLFRNLIGGIFRERILEGRGAQGSWLMQKDHLLEAQERGIPRKRPSDERVRRPALWNKKSLAKHNLRIMNPLEDGSKDV